MKRYSQMRKSITEPDESTTSKSRHPVGKKEGMNVFKVINEVVEKETSTMRKGERQRTKEEFLTSITNWQERKKLKQQEREAEKMSGVTFTP